MSVCPYVSVVIWSFCFHELACSSKSRNSVPRAGMQFHELADSSMSLHAFQSEGREKQCRLPVSQAQGLFLVDSLDVF